MLPLPGTAHQFDRFLRVLGVTAPAPDLPTLRRILRAHLRRVPFENISKALHHHRNRDAGLPPFEDYLDGIEEHRLGGTCYANNFYLHALLAYLGFETILCGCAMDSPDQHVVSLARIAGHRYLVDAGFGAPFDRPLPLDRPDPHGLHIGRERYVLVHDDAGAQMRHYRDGEHIHGYRIDPTPRQIGHFRGVIRHSYRSDSEFMVSLRYVRMIEDGRVISIRNTSFFLLEGRTVRAWRVYDRERFLLALHEHSGIAPHILAASAGLLPRIGLL